MSKKAEASGKYEYPIPTSFTLGKSSTPFVDDDEDTYIGHNGRHIPSQFSDPERQRIKLLQEEARRYGMDTRAVVAKRTKFPGASWQYASLYNWGIVTALKEYGVEGDKIVNVRWLSPENNKEGQWSAYCMDDLVVIWPAVDEQDIMLMVQQNNDV